MSFGIRGVTALRQSQSFRNLPVALTCLYLLGLLLNNFPPLVISAGGTTILRPDWLLTVPLVGYALYRRQVAVTFPVVAASVFLLLATIGSIVNPLVSPLNFFTLFAQLLYGVVLFTLLSSMNFSTDEMRAVLRFWVLLVAGVAVLGIMQALIINVLQIQIETTLLRGYRAGAGYLRPASVFKEPSFFGDTLLTGIAVLLPCLATDSEILFKKGAQESLAVILLMGLIISGSMGSYVTLVCGAVGVWILVAHLRGFISRLVVVSLPVGGTILTIGEVAGRELITTIALRMGHFADLVTGNPRGGSIAVRYMSYLIQLRTWSDVPLFGLGLGQYSQRATVYLSEIRTLPNLTVYDFTSLAARQNGAWVSVLAHTGAFGLASFLMLWVCTLRTQLTGVYRETGVRQTLIMSGICLSIALLVGWLFSFSFIHPSRWALIGLVYGYAVPPYLDS
ncbi:hypothetical protein [Halorussus amylolyticus]|uniref:hypothetical protein n=1 Tax=Halorussus amylolyticus TaxID=1126242 RepID=UPI00104A9442|nr:hypothetical protein [Halorussus amylolyticus]